MTSSIDEAIVGDIDALVIAVGEIERFRQQLDFHPIGDRELAR